MASTSTGLRLTCPAFSLSQEGYFCLGGISMSRRNLPSQQLSLETLRPDSDWSRIVIDFPIKQLRCCTQLTGLFRGERIMGLSHNERFIMWDEDGLRRR